MWMQAVVVSATLLMAARDKGPAPVVCAATSHGRAFERISIFNVDPAGKEYELAPDSERKTGGLVEQAWNLANYREMALVLRCRYRGTEDAVSMELPARVKTCTFRYLAGNDGRVVAGSEMACK
ncbi:MAG: hypothetical protein JWO80_648 [Bryobacterales bacterium]|nr:hypothetical protein [Bryobacterales bacterium]